ncbi:alkaline phosphatase family protein [Tepidimicrobium xylanilyticum]|uniref:Phosphoglycerol transferase MdoB n=1 Tax=Tepidimicrobium xylanilyticum TaxID=1123352 RepID=A0A1H3CIF9_9FIRM|nr:alkaline phosphatase family protein [Tepidimicrobium xylanilyticum]GMG97990.1 sulfatase [Tepidimicrobium xylanilyticum]SDX53374.1 Phosphoglycerol transferase MdoB [Tepidimicrobium xylanilyticum]
MKYDIFKSTDRKAHRYLQGLLIPIIIFGSSFLIMSITFIFSSAHFNIPMFKSYFTSKTLVFMNIFPILIFFTFAYILSNRLWLSFALSNLLFVTMSIINRFKLTFRDDPFTFIDITLVSESLAMTKRYKLEFTTNMKILIVGLIVMTIILRIFFQYKINSKKIRISILIVLCIISMLVFRSFYFDSQLYNELGDKSLINIWSKPQQFQSKGFVYPFIYSIKDVKDTELEGYDEKKAIEDLSRYKYYDIPQDQEVNIVAIMLEAYNDFTKFDTIEVNPEVYDNFHKIKGESVHGNLVTNIFAGDTIKTEREFLTGYSSHPRYLKNTNSFVWYFKEQGYRTEAMHPIYGWFYNRRNVNEYLGFDAFDYYENKYKDIQETFFKDMEFFDFIIEGYEKSKSNGVPYFNFTVTYQNHGPYSTEKYTDVEYLKKKSGYDEATYNIINNYLKGISETDKAMKKLFDYFRDEEEPVIIVLFGDHNPWLGEEASGYNMMGINIDLSTTEGFLNYYETPYIIWANEPAKEIFNKSFIGEGNNISPQFLMAELFQYLGWKGNEYMQYIMDLKAHIDVINNVYYKEYGQYTAELSEENQQRFKDFRNVEYYYSRNFKEQDNK